MDKMQLIAWVTAAAIRGVAWALAAWLGWDATKSNDAAMQLVNGVAAVILVVTSIISSIKGRKKLLMTPPPNANDKT